MSDQARLRELQSALRTKMSDNKAIADSFKIEEGTVVVSTDQKSAFDRNMSDIREIKSLIENIEQMESVEKWASEPRNASVAAADAATTDIRSYAAKTLGQAFVESTEFKSLLGGKNGANMVSPFQYSQKDVYSALPTGTPGSFGTIQRDPMVGQPTRTKRVRDLFPARTTTAAVIEYFRMLGFTTPGSTAANNAAPVAERNGGAFASKPQSSMQFVGQQAPIRTLAHWEAAHRNVLADEPQLL